MVQFLLQTGNVDVSIQDNMENTAIDVARKNQKLDAIAVLENNT